MKKYIVIGGVLVLSACGTKKNSNTTEVVETNPVPVLEEKFADVVRSEYNESEKRENDIIHTKIEVSFNWEKQQLNGKATIDVKPYFYPQNTLVLDAKGMDIHKVMLIQPTDAKDLKYQYDGFFLTIDLEKTYENRSKLAKNRNSR